MKTFGYASAILAILAALYLLTIPRVSIDVISAQGSGDANHVRNLLQAIKIYTLDKNVYPETLNELVAKHYLSEKDFANLTKDLKITYNRPSSIHIPDDYLLIIGHSDGYTSYGYVSGVARWERTKKTEQDAAANP